MLLLPWWVGEDYAAGWERDGRRLRCGETTAALLVGQRLHCWSGENRTAGR